MATYRIGIGSFNLKDGNIGIGTETTGFGNLKVEGTIKTTDLDVGISTFTRYSGFEAEQTNIIRDASYGGNESVTYTVTVIGGIFYIDGVSAPILTLKRGTTYTFDQSADTNSNHPFRFKDGDGNSYPNGVTATGTAGSSGAKVTLVVASNAPDDLRYYCTVHGNGMGNTISVINRTPSNLETTGDIVVDTGKTLTVGLGATISVGSVECISVKNHFSVPVGDTAGRNKSSGYTEGTVRYNRDLGTMEFFNGNEWRQFRYQSDARRSPSNRGRAVFSGGQSPDTEQVIDFVNVSTGGEAQDFGQLVGGARHSTGSTSNEIRGLIGGSGPGGSTVIEYITIGSKGNSIDFGDLTSSRRNPSGMSSSTRGIFACGSSSNVMDYVELMTLGNALDFGDCLFANHYQAACQSPTRGVIGAGSQTPGSKITFINIASKGNSVFFGEPNIFRRSYGGASNSVRGIFGGGTTPVPYFRSTEYLTIASAGNGQDFGELTENVHSLNATASQTKVLFGGGANSSGKRTTVESVTIASAGNAVDFGNLTKGRQHATALSDCHGGLGGY